MIDAEVMTVPTHVDVGIVGAGMAGAAAACALQAAGLGVAVYDKSRGPGGRMATRRHQGARGAVQFDHGAVKVDARRAAFSRFLSDAVAARVAAAWPAGGAGSVVGEPRMNRLVRRALGAADGTLTSGFEVSALQRDGAGRWRVRDANGPAPTTHTSVLICVPAPQAVPLLAPHTALADTARLARYEPCWTLMLAWPAETAPALRRLEGQWPSIEGVRIWSFDGGKPGRGDAATLVVHLDAEWSAAHLEERRESVRDVWVMRIASALRLPGPELALAHRWRFAFVATASALDDPLDRPAGLAVAGDWLAGPQVEDAFESGLAAAERLVVALR